MFDEKSISILFYDISLKCVVGDFISLDRVVSKKDMKDVGQKNPSIEECDDERKASKLYTTLKQYHAAN